MGQTVYCSHWSQLADCLQLINASDTEDIDPDVGSDVFFSWILFREGRVRAFDCQDRVNDTVVWHQNQAVYCG